MGRNPTRWWRHHRECWWTPKSLLSSPDPNSAQPTDSWLSLLQYRTLLEGEIHTAGHSCLVSIVSQTHREKKTPPPPPTPHLRGCSAAWSSWNYARSIGPSSRDRTLVWGPKSHDRAQDRSSSNHTLVVGSPKVHHYLKNESKQTQHRAETYHTCWPTDLDSSGTVLSSLSWSAGTREPCRMRWADTLRWSPDGCPGPIWSRWAAVRRLQRIARFRWFSGAWKWLSAELRSSTGKTCIVTTL